MKPVHTSQSPLRAAPAADAGGVDEQLGKQGIKALRAERAKCKELQSQLRRLRTAVINAVHDVELRG